MLCASARGIPANGTIALCEPSTPSSSAVADFGEDRLARFQSPAGVYHDAFEDFSTNEPTIDGTVSLLLLLSLWERP